MSTSSSPSSEARDPWTELDDGNKITRAAVYLCKTVKAVDELCSAIQGNDNCWQPDIVYSEPRCAWIVIVPLP
jgi:hypothetical protein